jgi:hypothetical protein
MNTEKSEVTKKGMGNGMKIFLLILGVFILAVVGGVVSLAGNVIGVRNEMNRKYQPVLETKSKYSAAVNLETQKIIGAYDVYDRGLNHESQTFKDYAAARSGFAAAMAAFQSTSKDAVGAEDLLKAQALQKSMMQMQQAMATAAPSLGINVQVEKTPELQWSGPANNTTGIIESAINHCQMALEDWISMTKKYNVYVGDFWPELIRGALFSGKFPAKMEYYEGDLTKVDMKSITRPGK